MDTLYCSLGRLSSIAENNGRGSGSDAADDNLGADSVGTDFPRPTRESFVLGEGTVYDKRVCSAHGRGAARLDSSGRTAGDRGV